jgi:hypothetical protein
MLSMKLCTVDYNNKVVILPSPQNYQALHGVEYFFSNGQKYNLWIGPKDEDLYQFFNTVKLHNYFLK